MHIMALMRRLLTLALLAIGLPAMAQTIFNCSSGFTTTAGACGVNWPGAGSLSFSVVGAFNGTTPVISGTTMVLAPTGSDHTGNGLVYQTAVNVQAFTSTFTFTPNGSNITFTLENNNDANGGGGGNPKGFSGGAGCEAGIYQAFGTSPTSANNIFSLELDSYSYLGSSPTFTYSSAQVYQTSQSPCNPNDSGPNYWLTNKISTSPVPLDSPASSQGTTTGDTYSATITYDGTNFTLNLYDVTAGGSCPGSSCFTQTWTAVDLPSLVNGNTAYAVLTEGTGEPSSAPLNIYTWSYTVNSAPSSPSLNTYTTSTASGSPSAANPTFSPTPGTYSGTQSVTLSSGTSGANICYAVGTSLPAIPPQPNNFGSCQSGTLYSGAITVSSTQNIYAIAGTTYTTIPSNLVEGSYTITSGGAASTPTFSPTAGTYVGAQSVTISTTSSGAVVCYTTNGTTPATNGATGCTTGTIYSGPVSVSSSETLKAVAGGTGYTDSSVGSAAYTIKANTPTFSPVAGTYVGSQSVIISSTSGSVICYNTTGSPATNGSSGCTTGTLYSSPVTVSSSQTLYAVAGGTGYSDSSIGSASYVVSSSAPAVIGGKIVISGRTVLK